MGRVTATLVILVLVLAGITGSSSLVVSVPERPEPIGDGEPDRQRAPVAVPDAEDEDGHGPRRERAPGGPVGAVPTAIFLPNAAAHVMSVGVEPDGGMEVPGDVAEVGWYSLTGVRPGDPGTAVLAGHVDSRTQGRGVFYDLVTLEVGDEILVDTVDGPQTWIVTETTSYDRQELPIEELFSLDGEPRLALVTCGGEFDAEGQSYRDNIVVYAHRTDVDGRM